MSQPRVELTSTQSSGANKDKGATDGDKRQETEGAIWSRAEGVAVVDGTLASPSGGGLALPRLRALHLWPSSGNAGSGKLQMDRFMVSRDQEPLLQLIHSRLEELSCHLTDGLVERLFTMQGLPLISAHEEEMHGEEEKETEVSPSQAARAWIARHGKLALLVRKWQRIRLRKLRLYYNDYNMTDGSPWLERHLLELLSHWSLTQSGPTSMILHLNFPNMYPGLLDCTFHVLAEHARLETLSLRNLGAWLVSTASILDIAMTARQAGGGISSGNSNCINSHGAGYDNHCHHHRHHHHHHHRSKQKRHQAQQLLVLFARLNALTIAVDCQAVPALAALFASSSLTRLAIFVHRRPGSDTADAAAVMPSLATLLQLQVLDLRLHGPLYEPDYQTSVTASDSRALQRLTELRVLRLSADSGADDLADADIAALLRALPHLHTLALDAVTKTARQGLLGAIGQASPRLRRIAVENNCYLAPTFDRASCTPLFPHLQELRLFAVNWDGFYDARYVCASSQINYGHICFAIPSASALQ